jgi:hypothetical protein
MDSLACNFDADANFNIPGLCCYPGYCNDRDIAVVCPALDNKRTPFSDFSLRPNPVLNELQLNFTADKKEMATYFICDLFGRKLLGGVIEETPGFVSETVSVSDLKSGVYILQIDSGTVKLNKSFIKL